MAGYDYVLIDSRTGVSDTSGICTVQMPDTLVICFTPNSQSIEGAGAVAESAHAQRMRPDGTPGLLIYPLMTRVMQGERDRVALAREAARRRFDGLLWHVPANLREAYWGQVFVPHQDFYSFEEVLAVFGDQPGHTNTMLAAMETLAGYVARPREEAEQTSVASGSDEAAAHGRAGEEEAVESVCAGGSACGCAGSRESGGAQGEGAGDG